MNVPLPSLVSRLCRWCLSGLLLVAAAGRAEPVSEAGADASPRVISRGAAAGSYQAFTDVCRLANGDLFCVFYAGYGHVSLPRADFPKGGRVCSVRSSDEGRTWASRGTVAAEPVAATAQGGALAILAGGTVYYSTDGGQSFTPRITGLAGH